MVSFRCMQCGTVFEVSQYYLDNFCKKKHGLVVIERCPNGCLINIQATLDLVQRDIERAPRRKTFGLEQ